MTNYNRLCIICLDDSYNQLSECSSGHKTCNKCLQTFMEIQSTTPEAVTKCTYDKCKKPLKMNFEIQSKMLEQCMKQISDLTVRIQKVGKDTNDINNKQYSLTVNALIQDLHKHIRTKYANDLVLKCPKCAVAFIDFDGCLALTCENCKAGFCALCLENCGDAHNHLQLVHGVVHDDFEKSNFKKANYKRTTDELIKIYEMISIFIVDIFKDLSGIHEYKNLDATELMKQFLGTINKGYDDYQYIVPQSIHDDDINQFNFWDKIREKHLKEIQDQFDKELEKCKEKLQDQFNEESYKYKKELQRQLDEEIYKHEKETQEQVKKYEKEISKQIIKEKTRYENEIKKLQCQFNEDIYKYIENLQRQHNEEIKKNDTKFLEEKTKYQDEIKKLKQNLENEKLKNKILEEKQIEYINKEQLYNKHLEKERLEKKLKEIEDREKIVRLKRELEIEKELEQERLEQECIELERLERERIEKERLEHEHIANKKKKNHNQIYKSQLNKERLEKKQKEIDEREKIVRLKRELEIEKEHINRIIYNKFH